MRAQQVARYAGLIYGQLVIASEPCLGRRRGKSATRLEDSFVRSWTVLESSWESNVPGKRSKPNRAAMQSRRHQERTKGAFSSAGKEQKLKLSKTLHNICEREKWGKEATNWVWASGLASPSLRPPASTTTTTPSPAGADLISYPAAVQLL